MLSWKTGISKRGNTAFRETPKDNINRNHHVIQDLIKNLGLLH